MKRLTYLLLPTLFCTLIACGGGGPNATVCNAATTKLFAACDQHDAADQQTIWNTLQGMGISISFAEIEAATPGEVAGECEQALSETTITDEQASTFTAALNDLTTCAEVVSAITQGFALL
ncbi:MAG: hypothetical protein V1798_05450 [Pseudomonadota bacterium]